MVTVVNYSERENKEGKSFFVLTLEGDLDFIRSKVTGKNYATVRRANVTSTLNEETCKRLIGKQISGSIQRVATEPYEYAVKETGGILTLTHQYVYCKEGELAEEMVVPSEKVAMPVI